MNALTWGMLAAGVIVLIAGLILVRARFQAAAGAEKAIVLGPVFEAVALAMFAAEHFLAAHDLMGLVPKWLPGPLFWTWVVGFALLAAAISLAAWRYVNWSAPLLALLFLIIVITIDLPNLPAHLHERLFWTLTMRETAFAGGAMALAGGKSLNTIGRTIVACACILYAFEHFLFPRFVPGVPLEKMTPDWVPAPVVLGWFVGLVLLAGGICLFVPHLRRTAAAVTGIVLMGLVVLFYVPILLTEVHSPLALEGMNYVGDTMLFAATVLLAGFESEQTRSGVGQGRLGVLVA